MYKEKDNLPPQKIAVMIDGGFFIKRFNTLYNKDGKMSAADVANALYTMALYNYILTSSPKKSLAH